MFAIVEVDKNPEGLQEFDGDVSLTFRCIDMASNSLQASCQGWELSPSHGEFNTHGDVERGQRAAISSDRGIGIILRPQPCGISNE